jgi:hypothetical protein
MLGVIPLLPVHLRGTLLNEAHGRLFTLPLPDQRT